MSLDEFLEWNAHLLLHSARCVDMAADTEQLGAVVALPAKRGKPVTSTTTDGLSSGMVILSTCSCGLRGKDHLTHGSHSNGLNISDSGWTSKYADISRKWWLQARFTSLPFEALDQCLQMHANFINIHYKATV